MRILIIYAGLISVGSYGFIILLARWTFVELSKHSQQLTKRARSLQRQLSRTLVAQVFNVLKLF